MGIITSQISQVLCLTLPHTEPTRLMRYSGRRRSTARTGWVTGSQVLLPLGPQTTYHERERIQKGSVGAFFSTEFISYLATAVQITPQIPSTTLLT